MSSAETSPRPRRRPSTPDAAMPRLLTVADVAGLMQLSTRQVRRLIAAERLPVVRIGRAVRVHPNALKRLIQAR